MSVRVLCGNPQKLVNEIKTAIRGGTIQTWALDRDGDFTHTPEQWTNKAWFRPVLESDKVVFKIIGQKSVRMKTGVYAAYHAHFIEMLLNHFDTLFYTAAATAQESDGDWIGPLQAPGP
jgi:hypothetical protein